ATWHRHADLRTCLPIFVVVAGEGELRHWVVAPFPLRRALRKRMREENAGSVALVQARRGLFAQTEERFGHGIGSILAGRSVTGVELGAQNSAAQSPQRIALDTTREPLEESVHLRRPRQHLRVAWPELRAEVRLLPVPELVADRPLMEPGA